MKIEQPQKKVFQPVVITLESSTDVEFMLALTENYAINGLNKRQREQATQLDAVLAQIERECT